MSFELAALLGKISFPSLDRRKELRRHFAAILQPLFEPLPQFLRFSKRKPRYGILDVGNSVHAANLA